MIELRLIYATCAEALAAYREHASACASIWQDGATITNSELAELAAQETAAPDPEETP